MASVPFMSMLPCGERRASVRNQQSLSGPAAAEVEALDGKHGLAVLAHVGIAKGELLEHDVDRGIQRERLLGLSGRSSAP